MLCVCSLPAIPGNEGEVEDEFIMGMSDGTLGVIARGDSTARFLPIQKGKHGFDGILVFYVIRFLCYLCHVCVLGEMKVDTVCYAYCFHGKKIIRIHKHSRTHTHTHTHTNTHKHIDISYLYQYLNRAHTAHTQVLNTSSLFSILSFFYSSILLSFYSFIILYFYYFDVFRQYNSCVCGADVHSK